jgi:hypothetical protein
MRLALDDFGDGRSSLRLWSEVKPDFVKIDKYFIREISDRPENLQMLRAIKGIADVFGTQLIAEGIETQDDLRALRDLDIPYGQGWLLGRPAMARDTHSRVRPWRCCTTAAWPCCRTWGNRPPRHPAQPAVVQAPTATPTTPTTRWPRPVPRTHRTARAGRGGRHAPRGPHQPPAVHEPLRHAVLPRSAWAQALPGVCQPAPRVVELDCDVEQLMGILTSQDQRYLSDGYIVTDNGRYIGLGTGDQLVRAVTERASKRPATPTRSRSCPATSPSACTCSACWTAVPSSWPATPT